jgi:hypothetical protein
MEAFPKIKQNNRPTALVPTPTTTSDNYCYASHAAIATKLLKPFNGPNFNF